MKRLIKIIKEGELGSRPTWDESHMSNAITISRRASCYKVHAGSVFVKSTNNRLVGTGYNGAPSNAESCLEMGGCYKEIMTGENYEDTMNSGMCRGIHGEKNALKNLIQAVDISELTLYTTIFPCNSCAKDISGIDKLVFKAPYDGREFESALGMLLETGTRIYQLDISPVRRVDIEINHPNVVHSVWHSERDKKQIAEINAVLEKIKGR